MKITALRTYLVPPRWLFLRIDTDEGITGWGEPVLEGRAGTVRAALGELGEVLTGADPLRIEDHWQVLTRGGFYRGGPVLSSAVAGIDQALWDIAGIVDRVAAVRTAIGADRDVAVDFHGRLSTAMSHRVLPDIEPLAPMFVEEPVRPEFSRDLAGLVAHTTVPLATGERLYSRRDFRDVLPTGIAVAQPDVSHAGGISEVRRIAAMAEAWDVAMALHCPLGPIALAASLQLAFAMPNTLIQEQSAGLHYNQGNELLGYLVDPAPFQFTGGYAPLTSRPGLGIEVGTAAVARAAGTGHRWRNPVWRGDDGSFREW